MIKPLPLFFLGLFICSTVHSQSFTITASNPLSEVNLDAEYLTVDLLGGETFRDYANLNLKPDSFILVGVPAGATIESVSGISPTQAQVNLAFDGTDFDVDYSLSLDIDSSILRMTTTRYLSSTNTEAIDAYVESATINDPGLNEAGLDGQTVTVSLTEETFINPGSLVIGDFTLNNAPAGLTVLGFTGTPSPDQAELDLQFVPGDFDSDYPNFSVTVSQAVLSQSDADLTTNEITITALVESAAITDPTSLSEDALDGQAVTITLINETFADLLLDPGNITLNNAPAGLTVESFGTVTSTTAVVNLAFTPGDFDLDIPNFSISIDPSELSQTSTGGLTTNEITILARVESASINDPPLIEDALDGQSVTITLANETFADLTLDPDNITLNNAPAGLTVESFGTVTSTTAVVNLAFTPGDFDSNIPNFSLSIDPSELSQTSTGGLTTNGITILAVVESAAITDPASLSEEALDGQAVTITLTDETFVLPLVAGNFTLNNAPTGLTIGSFGTVTSNTAVVNLAFVPGDFDLNISDFSVSIDQSQLSQTSSGVLTTNVITIWALVESAAINDPSLSEETLDGQTLTVTLTNETFSSPGTLVPGNFTLNNAPTGLSVVGFTGTPTATEAVLDLEFIPGDFDSDISGFSVNISPSALSQSSAGLTTNAIGIASLVESASINDPGLNEVDLDAQSVTITLSNETFVDLTLDPGNFTLDNAPGGLTIGSFTSVSSTSAIVNFAFTPGDFDVNITDFSITIDPAELKQTSGPGLTTNEITITAYVESALMGDPGLNETALDGQAVTITLTDETFDDPLEAVNFTPVNFPAGLSVESVIRNSATEAVVNLAFDGTDFDANYTDFYITIAAADLIQTSSGVLVPGNRLTITALVENPQAVMAADSILEERRLDARTLTITFTQESFNAPGSLVAGDFTPNNAPAGLSIAGLVGTPTATEAVLDLQFVPGDFDVNFPNFSVSIDPSVLVQSATTLTTNTLPISSLVESAAINNPGLNEANLDAQSITLTLTQELFTSPGSLVPGNFTLNNAPGGLTIAGFVGTPSSTGAVLDLQFIPGDFDADITNFSVTINQSVLKQSSADLTTNIIPIASRVESAAIDDPGLNEAALDGQAVTITLTDESFILPLDVANFTLNNAPAGLTIESFGTVLSTTALVNLAFTPGDFDADVNNFSISIDQSELRQTSSGVLTTNQITITAANESATMDDPGLNEPALDGQAVTITLEDEIFDDPLEAGNFNLVNFPAGLSIESVTRINDTVAVVDLAFFGDFETNFTDFHITINAADLVQTSSGVLVPDNRLTITALVEVPVASLSADSNLVEHRLDARTLTISLDQETFIDPGSLVTADFTLNNEPPGLTIESLGKVTPDTAVINLAWVPGDFDTNIPNLSVTISQAVLLQSGTDLTTGNTLPVIANIESATLLADQTLQENSLNGRLLTVTLVSEQFLVPGSVDTTFFSLINAPAGVGISNAYATAPTLASITLSFDGTDFDADSTGFAVRIFPTGLRYTSDVDLITNALTISAYVEHPQANLVPGPQLSEYSLNGRTLTINLQEESFIDPAGLAAVSFTPQDAPPGLTIQSVSATGTSADLLLGYNVGDLDFDIDYPNFHIMINAAVLKQSAVNLMTDTLSITYGLEPVITGVSIPDDSMSIGSVVEVTITVENDEGNTFSLDSGVIGGYPLTGLIRVNETTYTSNITITEGGLDYPASQDIHVLGVRLMNGPIPGNIYNGYIVQDNDPIDANRPVIDFIYTPETVGPHNIGDGILVTVQALENGLTFAPESHVNNIPLTDPSMTLTGLGGGRYSIRYLVQEGDDNVNPGELPVSIIAVDALGNESLPATIEYNSVSIDASRPLITRAYISSDDMDISVGETIEITVQTDQAGYRNLASTWINNIHVGPRVTFTDRGDGTYVYAYTVSETDGTVQSGNLAINIMLQDALPFTNTSIPFTDLDDNDLQIQTSRPSATISGSAQICPGDNAVITVVLGGTAPWTLDISDGSNTTQHTVTNPTYNLLVSPDVSTTYTVERVVDGTGNDNTGAGAAVITVPDIPEIRISNLRPKYDVKSLLVVLQYSPQGVQFDGPGISDALPWTFDPEAAGVSPPNAPHEIVYTYTDTPSGCVSTGTREVVVVSESGFIDPEREAACFYDSTFLITGINEAGTTGSFQIQGSIPEGAFTDNHDNTAVLRPNLFTLVDDRDLVIEYTFEDESGELIPIADTLTIEYLEQAVIDFIPDVQLCQNEGHLALSGNYEEDFVFSSTGTGVVRQGPGNYYFDPELADTGTNMVVYEYTSSLQCRVSDSIELTVFEAPEAGFSVLAPCIPIDGGPVEFSNRSGAHSTMNWLWNFGDPASGAANQSDQEHPVHHYSDTGSYTVSLVVKTTDHDCESTVEKTIGIYPTPEADFSWNSNCLSYDPVVMTGQETIFPADTVTRWSWKIDKAGTVIFSSDTIGRQLSYKFDTVGSYNITYSVATGSGCSDTIERTISLSRTHYLSPYSPYVEDFESEEHGWFMDPPGDGSQYSWTNEVDPADFPVNAASGMRAWYTDVPDEPSRENSWVVSPCFSFNNYHRAMVSLDIKRSLHRNRDGAALQYTTDNGNTWHNVGDMNDGGLNWYNSTGIIPSVGGFKTGWTGESSGGEDEQWIHAAHSLDTLKGQQEVRFRMAFGSLDDTRDETNDGFAFDNFTIKQRTRLPVLEYFTNANTAGCVKSDTTVLEIMNDLPVDVVLIEYHAQGSVPDQFFNDNPVPANNRGTVYGVENIPYAVLDGGIRSYDFSSISNTPNVKEIRQRSLVDPDFQLTIIISQYTPELHFSVEMTALRELVRSERTMHAIVLQRKVVDPNVGTNGITEFWQVARKMVPGATGTYLGNRTWQAGETESVDLKYDPLFFPTDRDSISIVVYVQDDATKEILQASTSFQYTTSIADESAPPSRILIYPNPAREEVNVYFEGSPVEKMRLTFYDLSGKMVITDVIEPWQRHFTRTLGDVEQGMYILEIRSWDKRRVLYRDKLLHY